MRVNSGIMGPMRREPTQTPMSGGRGQSELVGIILLFGMVIAAAGLVFVAGSSVIDSTQDSVEIEQLELTSEVVDEQLTLATEDRRTGQSLPETDVGQYNTSDDDGAVQVAWFNETTDPEWDSSNDWTSESATLGAVKLEHDELTLIHQAGGIWKQTNNGATMERPPPIAYDGERLHLELVQVEGQTFTAVDPAVSHDQEQTEALADKLQVDPDDYPPHYAIKIESQYLDAWEHALRETLDEDSYNTVNVSRSGDDYVVAKVRDLYNLDGAGEIVVNEDEGPAEETLDLNAGGNLNDNIEIDVELFNTGIDEETANDIDLMLYGPEGQEYSKNARDNYSLDGRENETETLTFPSGQFNPGVLETGVYEYDVRIDNELQLDDRGELFIGEEDTELKIHMLDVAVDGDTATVNATVENTGIETADNATIDYELSGEATLEGEEVTDIEWGSTAEFNWTIDDLPEGDDYEFEVETADESQTVDFDIADGAMPRGVYIERDLGVGEDQRVVVDDQTEFAVELWNTEDTETTTPLTVTVYDGDQEVASATNEGVTVDPADEDDPKPEQTVELSTDNLSVGEVYEYNVTTADDSLDERGSFYVGEEGTSFQFSNATAMVADANAAPADDTVDINVGLENLGIEAGSATLEFDLEYEDGETPDEYDIEPVVTDEFEPGQAGEIEWRLNRSRLFAGNHSVTVNDEVTAEFEVSTELDPGRTGISGIRNANVTTEILGTQTSFSGTEDPHVTAPIEFQVRGQTESDDDFDLYQFENHEGGTNLNTGPSWQSNEAFDAYEQTVTIDRDEDVTLSLRADLYEEDCRDDCINTTQDNIPNFDGDSSIGWLNSPDSSADETVDPVGDEELRRVRVRSAEENTIPNLPAGTPQQLSATDILDERDLIEEREDDLAELDLDDDEFVFLFQLTPPQEDWEQYVDDADEVDEYWQAAINAAQDDDLDTFDPNFNDAVVHVQVEHAPVDVSNPLLEIDPVKADPIETGSGDGGPIDVSDPTIDGSVTEGGAPDLDTGDSDFFDPVEAGPDIDLDVDVISLQ